MSGSVVQDYAHPPVDNEVCAVAVLPHEGTYSVMYGNLPVPVGSGYRRGYLARPDQAGRFPVVVICPDINGVSAHEKTVARRLARNGIAALAIDFYPERPADGDAALAAYHALTDEEALRTVGEVHEYLLSDDIGWAQTERVGVLGLDVGGRFALIAGAHREWVGAAAVLYAPLTGDEERRFPVADMLEHLPVPVLGLYGAEDDLIATETVDEAQNRNQSGTWLLYQGVGHGFLDEVGPGYDVSASEDAIARLVEFFGRSLPDAELLELG